MALIGIALVAAFVVSRGCQQSQVRITKEQAIATAKEQIEFTPQQTQIRLLRQGLSSKPFWIVSLSVPRGPGEGDDEEQFAELALVRVDANTGKVASVSVQRNENQPPQP